MNEQIKGKYLESSNLTHPQYLDSAIWKSTWTDEEIEYAINYAKKYLHHEKLNDIHPDVLAHWKWLSKADINSARQELKKLKILKLKECIKTNERTIEAYQKNTEGALEQIKELEKEIKENL